MANSQKQTGDAGSDNGGDMATRYRAFDEPGLPFFEPSLSMNDGVGDLDARITDFFAHNPRGGTDFSAAFALIEQAVPRDKRFDRYRLVITDGEPELSDEARARMLELMKDVQPMRTIFLGDEMLSRLTADDLRRLALGEPVVLDQSGAVDTH